MCSPRWVLLINIRNSTRGYEASKQSVISYMGFAKCLSSLDSKQGTSGPASAMELLWDSRAPRGLSVLPCLLQGCVGMLEWPSPCSLPRVANSTDISLLLAAVYLIFMHPSAQEYPDSLYAPKSSALLRYFTACVSFPSFSPLHWALQRCCHWVSLFCLGKGAAPHLVPGCLLVTSICSSQAWAGMPWWDFIISPPFARPWRSSECQEEGVQKLPGEAHLQKHLTLPTEHPGHPQASTVRPRQVVTPLGTWGL